MKKHELLEAANQAIQERKFAPCRYWLICYMDAKIQCVPRNCQRKPEIIFLTVSSIDCDEGLTPKQWDLLDIRLQRFWRQKKL